MKYLYSSILSLCILYQEVAAAARRAVFLVLTPTEGVEDLTGESVGTCGRSRMACSSSEKKEKNRIVKNNGIQLEQ